jgi:hypothetical protein
MYKTCKEARRVAGFPNFGRDRMHRGSQVCAAILIPLVLACAGCASTDPGARGSRYSASRVIGKVDPTGLVPETLARKDAATSIKDKFDQVDVEAINTAIVELEATVRAFRERVEALSVEDISQMQGHLVQASAQVRETVESTELRGALQSVERVTTVLAEKVQAVDVAGFNALLTRLNESVLHLDEAVSRIGTESSAAIGETRELVEQLKDSLAALPVAETRDAIVRLDGAAVQVGGIVDRLPPTAAHVDETLSAVRTSFRVVTVAGVLFGVCAVVWLVGAMRRSGG